MYAGCPIIWASKMQSLIALSTTEAGYIALSTALREVISVINLIKDLKGKGFSIPFPNPKIQCRTFEDNKSCIKIATNHKTRARTKHLSVKLYHFRSYVVNKTISIEHLSTTDQIADISTKPLPIKQFTYLRDKLMGWEPMTNPALKCEGLFEFQAWIRTNYSPCARTFICTHRLFYYLHSIAEQLYILCSHSYKRTYRTFERTKTILYILYHSNLYRLDFRIHL